MKISRYPSISRISMPFLSKTRSLLVLCLLPALTSIAQHPSEWRPLPLNVTLDRAIEKLGEESLAPIHKEAEALVYDMERPVITRKYSLEEVEKDRPGLSRQVNSIRDRAKREQLALALDDVAKAQLIREELITLATSYRYSRRRDVLQRIIDQVEEVCSWDGVQRPGWVLVFDKEAEIPEDAGAWRANAHLIFAFADVARIMPEGSLPEETMTAMQVFLIGELFSISEDFAEDRQPFFKSKDATSLDWVLLHAATIRAQEVLRSPLFDDQHNIAVLCLLRTLAIAGEDGSSKSGFMEGFAAVDALLDAARAMAVRGDKRLLDSQYYNLFIDWSAQLFQPGKQAINWGESRALIPFPKDHKLIRHTWQKIALLRNSARARFALERLTNGPTTDIVGFDYLANGKGSLQAPTTVRHFMQSGLIAWRSGWTENDSALWINLSDKGRNSNQFDRGHINLIFNGKPILIEAGIPPIANPQAEVYFNSTEAHNVLSIEGDEMVDANVRKIVSPLTERYGEVSLQMADFYPSLQNWSRKVTWSPDRIRVEDSIRSQDGETISPVIRWHLGADKPVNVRAFGQSRYIITWEGVEIQIETQGFIDVKVVEAPNYTLTDDRYNQSPGTHQSIEIRPIRPSRGMAVSTLILKR